MTLHDEIRRNRNQVLLGVAIASVLALGLAALRLLNAEQVDVHDVVGAAGLAVVLGIPAVLAWLSLDRRPSLLPAATYAALASGVLSSVLLVFWLLPVYVWHRAWNSRPIAVASPRWAPIARVGLAAMVFISFLVLFAHQDPRCSETLADGTVRELDPASQGLMTGWSFGLGYSSTTGSMSGTLNGDVVSSSCESDRIVIGEALAASGLALVGVGLATRWPQGARVDTAEPDRQAQEV